MPFGHQLLLPFNLENTFGFSLAAMRSSWHLASFTKDLAKQAGCLACFLAQIRDLEYCPLHSAGQFQSMHLAHIVCVQGAADTKLSVLCSTD